MKTCTKCGKEKEAEEFPLAPSRTDGRGSACKACKATEQRDRRAEQPREERNAQMAAYKHGMRKDKCAVCGSAIDGHGICAACWQAIEALGGTSADLKRAAKAVKWLKEM